jgi:hypothetical protein
LRKRLALRRASSEAPYQFQRDVHFKRSGPSLDDGPVAVVTVEKPPFEVHWVTMRAPLPEDPVMALDDLDQRTKRAEAYTACWATCRAAETGPRLPGVDLSGLVGKPLDYAAQEIARLLAPANADADRVTAAIQEAIAEALPDVEIFDPTSLSQDQLIAVMIEFLSRILFQQVVEDAASAWNKAPTAARTVEAEGQLLDLIKTAVDKHFSPSLAQTSKPLPAAQVERLQRQAMDEVWREWEAYS